MTVTVLEAVLNTKSNVGSDREVDDLKKEIISLVHTYPNASYTNIGCWRGVQQLKSVDFLLKEINSLTREVLDYYSIKDQVFSSVSQKRFKIHYWINVNSPGSRNVMHSHKPGVLSGVYYIQGSNTGDLRIINPANILSDCNPESPFTRDFFFTPKDKDLIMWPSWLPHEVEPNLSDKDRINIAFDMRFTDES